MTQDDTTSWRRLDAILDELLALPAAARSGRLDELTGGDPALRAEVEDLLRRDTADGGPLDLPAADRFSALLAAAARDAAAAGSRSGAADALAGRRVGPFRILGKLGEGGMGVVFEAQQEHPARTVALKVIRAGIFADDRQLRMFRREAESLGRLNHPGIAAIHDAGRTDDGLHWFAMERVEGVALDAWLRARPAPDSRAEIAARIGLCLEICDAVSHAHQRGVIHLDLKPSNVMVLPASASGTVAVKVLDFGVARFTVGDAVLTTMGGAGHLLMGTMAYMSPEQSVGDPGAVDVRSDLYSLGVLFYEAFTDRLPVEVHGAALPEALRLIREQPPRRPGEFARLLRGDPETVLLKALAKDPEQRYQSVDAFAEDLRRCRDDLPIFARPPSTLYQLRKIVVRHRTVLGFAAALLLTLVAAVAGTTTGLVRAHRAETVARQEAATAEETARFLESVFRVADPGENRGNAVTARELLDAAVADVDTQLVGQPRVKGRLLGAMGNAYRQLGLYREARPLLEQALAHEREALGPADARVGRSHYILAGLLRRLGEYGPAREHYETALAVRERALPADDPDLAASVSGLANLNVDEGRFAEASDLYRRALGIVARSLGTDDPRYAAHLANLAFAQRGLGHDDSACATMERVLALQRRTLAPDDLEIVWNLDTLAGFYVDAGNYSAARPLAEESLALMERVLGPDHPDIAATLDVLANLSRADGDHERARALHEREAAIAARATGADSPKYAMALDHLARDLSSLGRHEEAIVASRRAGEVLRATLPPEHPSIAMNQIILGSILRQAGRPADARPLLERALSARAAALGDDSAKLVEILVELARVARLEGRRDEARTHYGRALELAQKQGGSEGQAAEAGSDDEAAAIRAEMNELM